MKYSVDQLDALLSADGTRDKVINAIGHISEFLPFPAYGCVNYDIKIPLYNLDIFVQTRIQISFSDLMRTSRFVDINDCTIDDFTEEIFRTEPETKELYELSLRLINS